MDCLTADFEKNVRTLDALLGVGRCFDMISRDLYVGGKRARLWVVDGYGDDAVIERMLSFWLPLRNIDGAQTMQQFIDRYITFSEVNAEQSVETAVTSVFLGKLLLLIDGFDACALIDAKQFPARSVEEPSAGKVLRGAHDGFIETLVANAALLRRRIRDPQLTLEGHKVSDCSRADVVLCYLENKVDRKLLDEVRQKLKRIDVRSVSMSQESIAEAMMEKKQWWTPFPKVRYTERPDAATACVMEGNIVVLVDNSPAAMILPTHFFDFVQEANDYYFPPLIGTYLRVLRIVVFLLTMFITPVWYLLVKDPARTQAGLEFLAIESDYSVPLLVQLLLAEFIVGAVALVIVEVFPLQIAMLFGAANESTYYADFTVKCFRTYLCLMPLATLNKGTFIYLQALGKAFASTAVSMTREIIFGVSLPVILPVFFGLDGLLWSFPAADLLTFLIAAFFIRQTYRELSDVSAVHTEEET